MAETPIGDPIDAIDAMIDRATTAHDNAPDSEEHDRSWCAACWAERNGITTEQETPDA